MNECNEFYLKYPEHFKRNSTTINGTSNMFPNACEEITQVIKNLKKWYQKFSANFQLGSFFN